MSSVVSLMLALLLQAGLEPPRLLQIAPLDHPLNIIGNSWVVTDLQITTDGKVPIVAVMQGLSPFREIVLTSVHRWGFAPARLNEVPVDSRAMVIVLFRDRNMFSGVTPTFQQRPKNPMHHPPIPVRLTDPGYPANSIGEGAVILELLISPTGDVHNLRVISDAPGLARSTTAAVVSWEFIPAKRDGVAVPGIVIAAVSYLRPTLED